MKSELPSRNPDATPRKTPGGAVPFGVNEVRLNARQWLVTVAILLLVALLTPPLWERVERFDTGPDYRLPYQLSKDYWLYGRRTRQAIAPGKVLVVGDSVVWGEYVSPDGTLSHFLNREEGETNRFINAGANGLFPLALEGLVNYYCPSVRHQKVIVQCNVLWMTSPKADLSVEKEEQFNHSRLVPQFSPRIPCYKADASERLSAIVERNVSFIAWSSHLQDAYFGQKSILKWTLDEGAGDPPTYPNTLRNPFAQITFTVPSAPADDPQRGPQSSRHKPWTVNSQGKTHFDWVPLHASLQWHAFQRLIETLRGRGNDVLVVLGPFNEHMISDDTHAGYQSIRDGIAAWLSQNKIPCIVPQLLPSSLYADASHPLTEGYQLLATQLHSDEVFRTWSAGR